MNRFKKLVLLTFIALAMVLALLNAVRTLWPAKDDSSQAQLSPVARQMRKSVQPWKATERDIAALVSDMAEGNIEVAGLAEEAVYVQTRDGKRYFVAESRGARVSELLLAPSKEGKVPGFELVSLVENGGVPRTGALEVARNVVGILLPIGILAVLVFYMVGGNLGGGPELAEKPNVRFADVIGAHEAKSAVSDVIRYLKDPEGFVKVGARPPKGVLMAGPPGTGKTLLAKAIAGECGVNFIAASGSDFTSKFYGMGPQKVKALFKKARENAPCIVFIDEIDGIGKRTSSGNGPAESESNRIVNQMLIEMDGFAADSGVIVIGATNLVDNLDPALLREGRFDRRVHLRLPDVADRVAILRLYAKNIQHEDGIDFERLGRLTAGLSPAAIAHVVNHAATLAVRHGRARATMPDFVEAVETTHMGEPNGAVRAMTPEERHRVAVHEAGHAIAAHVLGTGRLEKVTILPRGGALGVTLVTPAEDRHLQLKSELENRLVMLLAGRNAEILALGESSSGAAHDLQEGSRIALAMVGQYGLGTSGSLFSLAAIENTAVAQEEMGRAIEEARRVLADADERCTALLTRYRAALDAVVERLLAEETIDASVVANACETVRASQAT